jgi:hypothetical protein
MAGERMWPVDGIEADELLKAADAKMYGQKQGRWYDTTTPDRAPLVLAS